MVRFVMLGLLRRGARAHGYALVKAYRERTGLPVNSGNFYRELQHLVAGGYVRAVDGPLPGDPRRRQVEITEAGRREFDAWFAGLHVDAAAERLDELALRTLFMADVEPALARRLAERWRNDLWLRSKLLERERDALGTHCGSDEVPGRGSGVGRRLRHVTADLEFQDELLAGFGARPSAPPPRSGTATEPETNRLPRRTQRAAARRR